LDKKIILFECNEIPWRILDFYCDRYPQSTLAHLLTQSRQYETYTEDETSLSPWKTWPSLHRGVNDRTHLISDLGDDLTEANRAYRPVWQILAESGIRTGVFGSLHSYPLPTNIDDYDFYVPDTFSKGVDCHPKSLNTFQAFNLRMVQSSSMNVSRGIPISAAAHVVAKLPSLGITTRSLAKVGSQLATEMLNSRRKVRRRTMQSVLAFDIFMKQLKSNKPDFVTFFTNHVASTMHRFWAAAFPEDYEQSVYPNEWQHHYAREIEFVMHTLDGFLRSLMNFVHQNPGYSLWLTSSMGQAATTPRRIETQLLLHDPKKLFNVLGLNAEDWSRAPAMSPNYSFKVAADKANKLERSLLQFLINGEPLSFRRSSENLFSLDFGHPNLDLSKSALSINKQSYSFDAIGLKNTKIEEMCNANAYHIPQGSLAIYEPNSPGTKERPQISTLDIAPALLANYAIKPPAYMHRAVNI